MIKVNIDGIIFEVETTEEAMKIAKGMREQAPSVPERHTHDSMNSPAAGLVTRLDAVMRLRSDGGDKVKQFTNQLQQHAGEEVSSEEFAKIIGVKDSRGIGPRLGGLQGLFGGTDIANLARRITKSNGERAWVISTSTEIEEAAKKIGENK